MALTHRIGRMSREHRPQPAVGQPTAGQFERWTAAQAVEVIGVLVAAGNGKNPRPQDRGQRMVSRAGSRRSASASSATPPSEVAPAIEGGADFLAPHAWQIEQKAGIVIHGGRGASVVWNCVGPSNQNLFQISCLRYVRQPTFRPSVNKTG